MRQMVVGMLAAAALSFSGEASAQSTAGPAGLREVALSVGPARLWHGDDGLGSGMTLGGAVTIPVWSRLAIKVDAHRTFGPEPGERSCSSFPTIPCSGVGHYGVRDLVIWSGNGVYYFPGQRVQPYISGGLDVLHFEFLSDVTFTGGGQARITESEQDHTTMGISLGAGLRVPVGSRITITPEVKMYDGTILAGANLTQFRTSVAVGYRW